MKWILLLMILVLKTATADAGTVVWTNPTQNATVIDSTYFDCGNGPALTDLDHMELWSQPVTGGGFAWVRNIPESGREGLIDSTNVADGHHAYLIGVDHAGNRSCASNVVCVNCPVTGVGDGDFVDLPIKVRFFDVHGRLVEPRATGIYFKKTWYQSGRVRSEKFVILK
jgi:hypothetical protein